MDRVPLERRYMLQWPLSNTDTCSPIHCVPPPFTGFSHFYLYDDNSTDNTLDVARLYAQPAVTIDVPGSVATPLQRGGVVTLVTAYDLEVADIVTLSLPREDQVRFIGAGPSLQVAVFNACTRMMRRDYAGATDNTWLFAHDVDEFVFLSPTLQGNNSNSNSTSGDGGAATTSLGQALARLRSERGATHLTLPRLLYGSNGHTERRPEPVVQRFTRRMDAGTLSRMCDPVVQLPLAQARLSPQSVWGVCSNYDWRAMPMSRRHYNKEAVLLAAVNMWHSPHRVALLPQYQGGHLVLDQFDVFQFNHYQIKSRQEFLLRRNAANSFAALYAVNTASAWFTIYDHNEVEDTAALAYLSPPEELQAIAAAVAALPPAPAAAQWQHEVEVADTAFVRAVTPAIRDVKQWVTLAFMYGPAWWWPRRQRRLLPSMPTLPPSQAAQASQQALQQASQGHHAQVLLLGMHHSGTSIATRLLMLAGLWAGFRHELKMHHHNRLKFFEHVAMIEVNHGLLSQQQGVSFKGTGMSSWLYADFRLEAVQQAHTLEFTRRAAEVVRRLDAFGPWLAKDPRTCLTASLWRPLLQRPVCVIMWRDPVKLATRLVAQSRKLARRSATRKRTVATQLLRTTQMYYDLAIKACVGVPTVVLTHAQLQEPGAFITRAVRLLAAAGVDATALRVPPQDELSAALGGPLQQSSLTIDADAIPSAVPARLVALGRAIEALADELGPLEVAQSLLAAMEEADAEEAEQGEVGYDDGDDDEYDDDESDGYDGYDDDDDDDEEEEEEELWEHEEDACS